MNTSARRRSRRRKALAGTFALGVITAASTTAKADFGGLSFWLPGLMGSLSAVPGQPGWSIAYLYVHDDARAGGDKEFQRGGSLVAGLHANADALAFMPSYTFETPVFGGRASVSLAGIPGRVGVNIDATLTGPRGRQISGHATDSRTTWADVYYVGSLKWNFGVHNTMIYVTGNIPSGTYDAARLANLSLGFWAVDAGAGYTYLDTKTGLEFSAVAGLTYSFINPYFQYQNGIDFHLDWAASRFLSKAVHIGVVGYVFQQLTGDSGAGATLGDFRGRAIGIGPQIGFFFPAGENYQGYLNIRGYKDIEVENRPINTTLWVTLAFSPAEHSASTPQPKMPIKAR